MALTIKDIARETGYAISTVSRALNDKPDVSQEAKDKIRAVVEARGFVPNANAKQLKQQTANAVAIIVKGRANMLFLSIVEQMQACIEQAGCTVLISTIDEDDDEVQEARRLSAEAKPLGIAFLGGNPESFKAGFSDVRLPGVLVTNSAVALDFANLSSVTTDDLAGAALAADHLIEHGHRNIAVLGGNPEKSLTSRLRLEGCLKRFAAAEIPFNQAAQFQKSRFSYDSAYRNFNHLYESFPGMTALFAMSDVMAVGAVRAMRDRGLSVPGDVSVVGFDGTEMARYYNPKLATVRQNSELLARRSVEVLLERIREGQPAVHEVVFGVLLEGESVGPPQK